MSKKDDPMIMGFIVNRVAPAKPEGSQMPRHAYNIAAARVEITALDYANVDEVLPQGHFESDGNLAEWLDDGK